jgi:hemerythrin-like domain-containing protein
MKATDILMAEHRVIERVLRVLETAAQRLEQGETVRPGFFLDAADFFQGFADACHHQKEEGVLFKAMVAGGMPGDGGPVNVMLSEHELGRAYTRALRDAAQRLGRGEAGAASAVVYDARAYTELLRQHIAKEDNVLYPLASRVIPADEQDHLVERFEHIEPEEAGAGVHEKYLALADRLAREMQPS